MRVTEPDWNGIRSAYLKAQRGDPLSRAEEGQLRKHCDKVTRLLQPSSPSWVGPAAWLNRSLGLSTAAIRLLSVTPDWVEQFYAAVSDDTGHPLPAGGPVDRYKLEANDVQVMICLMLAGMSAEAALKGLALTRGKQPRRVHELRVLVQDADVDDLIELDGNKYAALSTLKRTEQAVIWSARYPHSLVGNASYETNPADPENVLMLTRRFCNELARRIGVALTPVDA